MKVKGYKRLVDERVEELGSSPGFSINLFEVAPPVSEVEVSLSLEEAQGRFPVGLEDFYRELNGFRLEWEYIDPEAFRGVTDRGSIGLLPLSKIFKDGLGETWFDDFEGGDRFRNVKPFDVYMPEACMAFIQEPGEIPQDDVYYHYFGEDKSPLHLTFPQYLEGALSSCGFQGWQMALTPDAPGLPQARAVLNRMQEIIPGFAGLPTPGGQ